jgi:hypothetical protein
MDVPQRQDIDLNSEIAVRILVKKHLEATKLLNRRQGATINGNRRVQHQRPFGCTAWLGFGRLSQRRQERMTS